MFCDIVESTRLSERVDPEVLREILVRYYRMCDEVVTRFEGHVVQYRGDGVVAYFGYPTAHEDDARRAVFSGLDIVEAAHKLDIVDTVRGELAAHLAQGISLSVRVGIHTSLVVITEVAAGRRSPDDRAVGEAVNVAARVHAFAEPGSLVITEATHRLVQGYVGVVPIGRRQVPGVRGPIELFRALSPSGAESRLDAMPWRRIPLVNRDAERTLLSAVWERVLAGAPEAIAIVGEAGIGKSRLVECFAEQISAEAERVALQCSPYHSGTALAPVVRVIERVAGIRAGDEAATRRRRLAAFLDNVGGSTEADVDLFASLLSITPPPGALEAQLTAEERRERTLAGIVALIEGTAARRPLLLTVEDLDWADPTTLELLRRLVERSWALPLMLLCTARGDETVPFPDRVTRLRLGPLEQQHRREMVDRLAAGALDESVLARVADRSDGIPLYIEELTHAASGLTEVDPVPVDAVAGEVPPVLADLFTARLEHLPDRGYLAQVVATIGSSAPLSLLGLVLNSPEGELREALRALVEAGVLQTEPSAAEPTYGFRHALLRDAAYHSQLLSQRQALHGHIAEVLEEDLPGMASTRPELLAHHLQHAERPAQAARRWLQAGQQAAQFAAHAEAVGHYRRTLALLAAVPPDHVPEGVELDVQMELGHSLLALRGYTSPAAGEAYRRARDLSTAGGTGPGLATSYGLWAFYVVRGEHHVASHLARQAVAGAEASGSEADMTGAAMMLGYQLFFTGDLTESQQWLERGTRGDPTGPSPFPQEPVTSSGIVLATLLLLLGRPVDARRELERALARGHDLDLPSGPFTRALSSAFAAWFEEMCGDSREAARHARAGIEVSTTYGFLQWLVACRFHRAIAEVSTGDPRAAAASITEALALWRGGGAELFRSYFLGGLAKAHRACGDAVAALRSVDEALSHVERYGERFYEAELRRLRAELLLGDRAPPASDAEAEYQAALDAAHRQGARWMELRVATSLHELHLIQERGAQTEPLLRSLVRHFVNAGSGDLPDVQRALALLTAPA